MQDQIIASHICFGGPMDVIQIIYEKGQFNFFNVTDHLKKTTNACVTPFRLTFKT